MSKRKLMAKPVISIIRHQPKELYICLVIFLAFITALPAFVLPIAKAGTTVNMDAENIVTADATEIISEWTWQNPLPQGNTLRGVWGSSSSDVFAVGAYGTILHYDGSTWSEMSSGTTNNLYSIWGSSSSDVFAVGDSGTILNYDGSIWSEMPSGTTINLFSVWGSSSSDVFGVGDSGTILRYDGSTWSETSSGTADLLRGVWGSSSSDVFAVGYNVDSHISSILHYNGSTWSEMPSDTTYYLHSVWGSSSSDVFAVSSYSNILYYDGSTWSEINDGRVGDTLTSVWCGSASDVFVASVAGMDDDGCYIFQYDGSFWNNVEDADLHSHPRISLYSIWGSSSSDVFAVGSYGVIFHYDGSTWSEMSIGTTNDDLYCVWGSSSSDVFAVGADDDFGNTILHYDGTAWNNITDYYAYDFFTDIWGSSSSDVFAVGGYGTILHYDGSTWSEMADIGLDWLLGIWGSSSSDVFIVGGSGFISHYDGSTWAQMESGTIDDIWGVWGSSSSDVFAVGRNGTILHYDGSTWSKMTSVTSNVLNGVWGSSSSDVFAVGSNGTILHYNGSTWNEMSSGTSNVLNGVWGSSSSDVFAIGGGGTILHYNGSNWSEMSSGTPNILNGVWGSSSSDVFAIGRRGTILHYSASPAIASIVPDSGGQGEALEVIITGTYLDGVTNVGFGSGITVNNLTSDSATQIRASISIDAKATTGLRDISVTSAGGTDILSGGFTVKSTQITHDINLAVIGNGITSPSIGSHTYNEGTVVDINATPNSGWQFVNWSGDVANPYSASTTVTMNADKTVTANFTEIAVITHDLNIDVNGNGTTSPSIGSHTYNEGTVVEITAIPDSGWQFINWAGDVADPYPASTTVIMNADKTVSANFTEIAMINHDLTIAVNGNGTTTPSIGVHTYVEGEEVNITANPDPGWQFNNWIGEVADPNSLSTTVTVDGDKTVTAAFTEETQDGETGGCCSSNSSEISVNELTIGWGIIGMCWGGGYYMMRRSKRRKI